MELRLSDTDAFAIPGRPTDGRPFLCLARICRLTGIKGIPGLQKTLRNEQQYLRTRMHVQPSEPSGQRALIQVEYYVRKNKYYDRNS